MKSKMISCKWTLAVIILMIIAVFVFLINFNKKEVSFPLNDNCGLMVNMVSHTIGDEDACRIKCMGQCESKDLGFSRVEFRFNAQGCNNCACFCK